MQLYDYMEGSRRVRTWEDPDVRGDGGYTCARALKYANVIKQECMQIFADIG